MNENPPGQLFYFAPSLCTAREHDEIANRNRYMPQQVVGDSAVTSIIRRSRPIGDPTVLATRIERCKRNNARFILMEWMAFVLPMLQGVISHRYCVDTARYCNCDLDADAPVLRMGD